MRTRPLETLIIGAYVRGLSDRDIEALVVEAGLGKVSKSTVSDICRQLRSRYQAFRARSVVEVELLVLFLDAIYLPTRPTRPSGAKVVVDTPWTYASWITAHRARSIRLLGSSRLGRKLP